MRRQIMAYVREKYQIAPVYPWRMQPKYAVLCHRDTLKWFALLMNVEGSRIGLEPMREYELINLRVPEEEVPQLLRRKGFLPAYHMTAREWVAILLNEETISIEELLQMLDRSYQLTRQPAQKKPGRPFPGGSTRKQSPGRPASKDEGVIRFGRRYSDQPLSASAWSREESLPAKIREMKTLARPGRGVLEENIFYQQAVYMADYEDDFRYKGRFMRFYPTYQTMTSDQLRGYFGWRTRFRKGETRLEQLPYIYLYLFEVLCGIGIQSPEEGLEKLREADRLFGEKDKALQEKLRSWMRDYVVYHAMSPDLLAENTGDLGGQLSVLLRFENAVRSEADAEQSAAAGADENAQCSGADAEQSTAAGADENALRSEIGEEEVFEALCSLSSYDLTASAFYKKYPEEMRQAAVYVLRELCLARKDRKMTLVKKYFGIPGRYPYSMFNGAVFYDPRKPEDAVYLVNEALQYECTGGRWYCRSYSGTKDKNKELGNLCHEIDRQLRIRYGIKSALKQRLEEKAAAEQIARAVGEWYEQKKEAERKEEERKEAERRAAEKPQLEIDFSILSRIRADADQTRDKLIVEEGEEFPENAALSFWSVTGSASVPAEDTDLSPAMPATEDTAPVGSCDTELTPTLPGLSQEHVTFVKLLLEGKDWRGYVAEHHLMLSLLVDEVNEAFYDEIGDTVLEFDGAEPHLVEDYEEDLRQYLESE